jgi:hypothetical protein
MLPLSPLSTDSVYSGSVYSDSAYSDSAYSDSVYSDSVYSDSVYSDSVYSDSVYSDSVYSDSVYSDSVYSDSVYSDSVYSQHILFERTSSDIFSNYFHFLHTLHCIAMPLHCTYPCSFTAPTSTCCAGDRPHPSHSPPGRKGSKATWCSQATTLSLQASSRGPRRGR